MLPEDIAKMNRAELDRLRRELAEAQQDAARYRWLRVWFQSIGMSSIRHPTELDAAIDADMATPSPPTTAHDPGSPRSE
jgi:hypothetical protein